MKIAVVNGPNLNLLGLRNPEIYGSRTIEDLYLYISCAAEKLSAEYKTEVELEFYQSNCEGELIDYMHGIALNGGYGGLILNAGAYTHYSYAIRDAVEALSDMKLPTWEVHISDVEKREDFRKISVIRPVCKGCVFGLGFDSYTKALRESVKYNINYII